MDKRVSRLVLLGFGILLILGLGISMFLLETLRHSAIEAPAFNAKVSQLRGSIRQAEAQYLSSGLITSTLLLAADPASGLTRARQDKTRAASEANRHIARALNSTNSPELQNVLRRLQLRDAESTATLEEHLLRLATQDIASARSLYLTRYVEAQRRQLALIAQALQLAQAELDRAEAASRSQTAGALRVAKWAIALFCALALVVAAYLARAVSRLIWASAELAEENRNLIDNSLDVICTVDSQGRFVRVGGGCERLWGYTPEQLRGRAYITLVHPEDVEKTNKVAAEIVAGRSVLSFTNRYLHKNGSVVHTTWAVRWVEKHQQMFAVAHDVTLRELALAALRDSEEHTRLVLATAHDAFVGLDLQGLVTEWNPQAERTFGWARSEALGQALHLLIVPDAQRSVYLRRLKRFQSTKQGNFLNRLTVVDMAHRDGHLIPIEFNISAIKQAAKISFGVFLRDISERLQAEKLLHDAKQAAEGASRAKSDFLAKMSHEIRTPMNGVLGTVDLLLNSKLSAAQRELVTLARASGETLLTIIDDVLDFAKIEAGKLVIEPVPFDLLLAVEEVSGMVALQAEAKQLDLIVRYPPEVPHLFIGDQGRIRQVLINLVSNALKFTSVGHVLIDVGMQARNLDDAVIRIEVQDSGIGISEGALKQVFGKFTQADSTTTRRFGGTGLGLAICTELVTLMGGQIGARSQPGLGSTFYFTLPLPLQQDVPVTPLPIDLAGTRALIVDDQAIHRRVLHEQMLGWKMRTDSCASAAEALTMLRAAHAEGDPFKIAILDYQMPDVDGAMLSQAIKADPTLSDLPLVLLTSLERRGDAAQLQAIGFAAQLVKPLRQSELLATLLDVCSAHRQHHPSKPCARPAAGDQRTLPPDPVDQPHLDTRVLLVEDNSTNQVIAKMMLRALGCDVDICSNGQLALEQLSKAAYQIVFMDCEMPVLDGYAATAAIRARTDAKQRIPIIALTAQAMQGDRERCLQAGMDGYLSKPVKLADFARELRRWVPETALAQPDAAVATTLGDSASLLEVFEPGIVSDLRRLSARTDAAVFEQIFAGFYRDSQRRLQLLQDATAAGTWGTVHSIAHAFKGAAASVGAQRLSLLADQLESFDPDDSVHDAQLLINRLAQEIALAGKAITALGVSLAGSTEARL